MTADASTLDRSARSSSALRAVPALTIASHPNAERVGDRLLLLGLAAGREVALSRNEPEFARPAEALGAPLADPFVSRRPVRFVPGKEGGVTIVAQGNEVTIEGVARPSFAISHEAITRGVALALFDRIALVLHMAPPQRDEGGDALGMVGQSTGIAEVRRHIMQVADVDVPVLIRGETGSGKELVARAIHEKSPRARGAFIGVNLGALSRELAAAELFGQKRGAFTGATQDREGYWRAARGGTLFLDEIGEAPPEVQVMLLRALETGEVVPVGAEMPVAVDVRVVAATDAKLEEQIQKGQFKAPLLHRLAGYEIRVPPLRERREDIGPLFYRFAREELSRLGEGQRLVLRDPRADPWLPPALMARLVHHPWPGNVRELRNVARQLVIGHRGHAHIAQDAWLGDAPRENDPPPPRENDPPPPRENDPQPRRRPADVSEDELRAALREAAWDLQAAADKLGIPRPSMYDLLKKHPGIRTVMDLSGPEIAAAYEAHGGDVEATARTLEVSARALKRRTKELKVG
ncbi:Functional role page for Anaerobic nitric oxide reductase transcription regulator NorR [Minicystis rosea]|nr:Functional role page for Anaerobic nitric oxide reductase transcription regulator NorR [Minicystis rosea]